MRYLPVAILLAAFTMGCAAQQRIKVSTEPPDATVKLKLSGTKEVDVNVAGVHAEAEVEAFEEDYATIGSTPVDYTFLLETTETAVSAPAGNTSIRKVYKEGTLLIEMEGYLPVEEKITCTGKTLTLDLDLVKDEHALQ